MATCPIKWAVTVLQRVLKMQDISGPHSYTVTEQCGPHWLLLPIHMPSNRMQSLPLHCGSSNDLNHLLELSIGYRLSWLLIHGRTEGGTLFSTENERARDHEQSMSQGRKDYSCVRNKYEKCVWVEKIYLKDAIMP